MEIKYPASQYVFYHMAFPWPRIWMEKTPLNPFFKINFIGNEVLKKVKTKKKKKKEEGVVILD